MLSTLYCSSHIHNIKKNVIALHYRNSPLWELSFHVNSRLAVTICGGHNVPTSWHKCAEHSDTSVHPRRHKHSGLSFLKCAAPSEKDSYQYPHQCNQGVHIPTTKFQGEEYAIHPPHLLLQCLCGRVPVPPILEARMPPLLTTRDFFLHSNMRCIKSQKVQYRIFRKGGIDRTLKSISSCELLNQ
jgi:hypothetical protein